MKYIVYGCFYNLIGIKVKTNYIEGNVFQVPDQYDQARQKWENEEVVSVTQKQ